MKQILCSLLIVMISLSTFAQIQKPSSDMSYRKKITMADEFMQKGDYGSAAAFYQSAFEEKTKKIEIAEKAGNAFVKIRDYENAAAMFKVLTKNTKSYPKAQYRYAKAVKQSGDYQKAINIFQAFINNYRAKDFNEMNDKVTLEIKGCELAIRAINSNKKSEIEIEHLSRMVNSDENEFAPIPFAKNLLYFSSMRNGTAQIFRSEKGASGWDRPEKPQIFGSMERPHFGHGTFTPDRRAFYFTQCDMNLAGEFSCDIYIMQRINNKWAKPIRLPDYINEENTTNTMPFVTIVDDKEILYFVSDREGGNGGTDIWFVTKEGNGTDFSFSLPVNAGTGINTPGNEVSPFYDKTAGIIYFSSDGHPGFGGLDIFRSNGSLNNWDEPTNLGKPINSHADDKYYVLGSNREYGYFISNRLEETEKKYTNNDDIFYFEVKEVEVVIRGSIAELGNESKLLDNVTVNLIIIEETGAENRLETKVFNDGEYYFKLSPNREYKIEATKDGYETMFFELETNTFTNNSEFVQDLALEKVLTFAVNEEVIPSVRPPGENHQSHDDILMPPPGGNRIKIKKELDKYGDGTEEASFVEDTEFNEQEAPVVTTPMHKPPVKPDSPVITGDDNRLFPEGMEIGEYYKIQLVAVTTYKPYKYESLTHLGAIQLESTQNSYGDEIQRVMLTPFETLDEAKTTLEKIVKNPRFKRAYIVKYIDGERVKDSKIRLASFRE